MKLKLFSILFMGVFMSGIYAQTRVAVIDTDYILNKIPEYTSAQSTLDDLALEWQQEIEQKFAEIEKMYKAYQAEAVLLPEDMKMKRQDEIIKKEREVKDLQKKRFGTDGDLFKKRQELIKPIQDRIYIAIEDFANEGNFQLVLDRANSSQIMFVNSRLEKSDDVLKKLGY
jgi:outer membrane protein